MTMRELWDELLEGLKGVRDWGPFDRLMFVVLVWMVGFLLVQVVRWWLTV